MMKQNYLHVGDDVYNSHAKKKDDDDFVVCLLWQ